MARSVEYPDLPFVQAKGYGKGRDGKAPRFIVIHYTAGSERSTSAEDGAAYDARRTDGTSTHVFADSTGLVQCVLTTDRANAARHKGNRLGVQIELCGTVQTRAQWLDPASLATLRHAARWAARVCKQYSLPARRLSVDETRRAWTEFPKGPRGIVGHVDCTLAYPEDGGNHTDPGAAFPWDVFLPMVQEEIDKLEAPSMTINQADVDAVWSKDVNPSPTVSNLAYTTLFGSFQAATTVNGKADVILTKVTDIAVDAEDANAGAAAATVAASKAAADVAFLGNDFPGEDPEADPIVRRIRYVLANPLS